MLLRSGFCLLTLLVASSLGNPRTKRDLKSTLQTTRGTLHGEDFKEAIKKVYTEDAKYITHDGKVIDRDGIAKYWEDGMQEHGELVKSSSSVETLIEQGDIAIDIGKCMMTMKMKDKDGKDKEMEHAMRHLGIWTKVENEYNTRVDGMWPGDGSSSHPEHDHHHHHGHDEVVCLFQALEHLEEGRERVQDNSGRDVAGRRELEPSRTRSSQSPRS